MSRASTKPSEHASTGPLHGLRVIEFAGIGPCPMVGMMLADMGADVIVVDRVPFASFRPVPDASTPSMRADGTHAQSRSAMNRHKRVVALDLKHPDDFAAAWQLIESADALIEGFRPGVMERLGLGPDVVAARAPKLVYGRVTGWGQHGPLAQAAGHDLNYVAITGVLDASSREGEAPIIPGTIVGDMAGGAMHLAFGVVCALLEAARSARGQVVDAAMVDGVAALAGLVQQMRHTHVKTPQELTRRYWPDEARHNFFRGAAPFYDVYRCSDGLLVSVAAIEAKFYATLLGCLKLHDIDPREQHNETHWPAWRQRFAEAFATRTRAEWCAQLEGSDACFAPVLDFEASKSHAHLQARGTWVPVGDTTQAAPAPRLSRTPALAPTLGAQWDEHTDDLLAALGWTADAIAARRTRVAMARQSAAGRAHQPSSPAQSPHANAP